MKNFFSSKYWHQRDMELFIGKWLRIGVFTSAAVALVGGIVYLSTHHVIPDYQSHNFTGAEKRFRNFPDILHGALALNGPSIIQLAVIILIATPIFRIVFSVFAFAIERDKMYVVITLIVLSVILFGIFSGLGG
jgi:uncharacterized membrane protein